MITAVSSVYIAVLTYHCSTSRNHLSSCVRSRAVLARSSEPLKAAVQGGFMESHTGTIKMDSFHVRTVKNFVQFMYTGDYNNDDPAIHNKGSTVKNASNTAGRDNSTGTLAASALVSPLAASFLKHVRANCIGDYYKVDGLVGLANERVKQLITYHRHAGEFCSVLLMAAEEAAGSTGDKGLQEILGTAVGERIETLQAMGLLDLDHFRGMGFGSDLSIKVLQKSSRFCNRCSRYQGSYYY